MSIQIGQSLLHYQIVEKIGEGGMGVVWKAIDTTLDREVAIKVLPEAVATDPDRLTRFAREAKLLASLNHPSIAAIYGLHESNNVHFLAMELVPGETLAARLLRGPLNVEEALDTGRQIAEALEAAHEKGVIHRDLKPANIQLATDGKVKVLDFGLAKALSPVTDAGSTDTGLSPTVTSGGTVAGMILGTAAYMSPEQTRGRVLDKRTDIWSFGVVLYECLTGEDLFRGETVSDSIGATLHKEPDWSRLPAGTPPTIHLLLRRCLTRDRKKRLHDIADARIELGQAIDDPTGSWLNLATSAAETGRRREFSLSHLAWILVLMAIAATAAWRIKPTSPPPTVRSEVSLPEGERLTHLFRHGLSVSPDGRMLAFVSGTTDSSTRLPERFQIWLRPLDQRLARPLAGAENGLQPVFSPDGKWLAFLGRDDGGWALKKVSITGGEPTTLLKDSGKLGASWGIGDTIVFGRLNGGLGSVSASGAEARSVTELDEEADEVSHRLPHFLPGGKTVLFTALQHSISIADPDWLSVFAVTLETGKRKLLIKGASDARFVPTGHLVFAREGRLMAVPFDPTQLELTGPEVPVLDGVSHAMYHGNTGNDTSAAQFAFSDTGLMAYAAGSVLPEGEDALVWVDREGREEPVGVDDGSYGSIRVSPDGSQLLLGVTYAPRSAAWLYDVERKMVRRQTFEEITNYVVWGPGPDLFSFVSNREGRSLLYSKTIDSGPDTAWPFIDEADGFGGDADYVAASSSSPAGERLAVVVGERVDERWNFDIWILPKDGPPEAFLDTQFIEAYPEFSPDGKWITFTSNESGQREVYLRSYPNTGVAVQVSRAGGRCPIWSRDGREIFYRMGDKFFAVPVTLGGDATDVGEPVELFEEKYGWHLPVRNWDVAPDGRFLLVKSPDDERRRAQLDELFPARIQIIQNWFAQLE